MRYYEIAERPVIDAITGRVRPTVIRYSDGGYRSTRFIDPDTGRVYRAIRRGAYPYGGRVYATVDFGRNDFGPADFRRDIIRSRTSRTRRDGTVRPVEYGYVRSGPRVPTIIVGPGGSYWFAYTEPVAASAATVIARATFDVPFTAAGRPYILR